jgi:hypothetical protein
MHNSMENGQWELGLFYIKLELNKGPFVYAKYDFSLENNALKLVTATRAHKQKQTPWPLVCKRTIPTEPPPPVNEI